METEEQHREAVKMGMVAVSPAIARKVTDHVLKVSRAKSRTISEPPDDYFFFCFELKLNLSD